MSLLWKLTESKSWKEIYQYKKVQGESKHTETIVNGQSKRNSCVKNG